MQTLKVLFWNILFLVIFAGLCFAGLEFYLRTYQSFSTETVSAVGVPIFKEDALNTYSHLPKAMARNGYGLPVPEIFINNLGFRNQEDYEARLSQPSVKNVLLIGDSFTFGTGVDQDETFVARLEQALNPKIELSFGDNYLADGSLTDRLTLENQGRKVSFEGSDEVWSTWNAGHIGYSIGNYYLLLKKYAEVMPIDTVVINLFVANDITELRRKSWVIDQNKDLIQVQDQKVFANTEHKLESRMTVPPKSLAWHYIQQRLQILRYKLELEDPEFAEPTLTWPVFLAESHPAWDPNLPDYWERFFQGMQLLQDFAAENDIILHFALLPMDVQVDDIYRSKYARIYFDEEALQADRPQKTIMSFCAARQMSCLDLLPLMRQHPERKKLFFNYNADPHFDALGHEVTAKALADFIKN